MYCIFNPLQNILTSLVGWVRPEGSAGGVRAEGSALGVRPKVSALGERIERKLRNYPE